MKLNLFHRTTGHRPCCWGYCCCAWPPPCWACPACTPTPGNWPTSEVAKVDHASQAALMLSQVGATCRASSSRRQSRLRPLQNRLKTNAAPA